MGPSKNFIAIGKADSKDFYLNGDRLIELPGEYDIAGAVGLYEREAELEKMIIPGPIKHDIAIYVSNNEFLSIVMFLKAEFLEKKASSISHSLLFLKTFSRLSFYI